MKKTGSMVNCVTCSTSFYLSGWQLRGGYKFCSSSCYWSSRKGVAPKHINYATRVPWNRGKKGTQAENQNGRWSGDSVGYFGLHLRIPKRLGRPTKCEHCGRDGLTRNQIHWANKSHLYTTNISDWIRLCVKCHKAYDREHPQSIANRFPNFPK